jgi:hypothetical protein
LSRCVPPCSRPAKEAQIAKRGADAFTRCSSIKT